MFGYQRGPRFFTFVTGTRSRYDLQRIANDWLCFVRKRGAYRRNAASVPSQLRRHFLDVYYQRAPCPRKFGLHRHRNVARIDNLGSTGDEVTLARAARSLHLPTCDEELHAVVLS